MNPGGGPPKSGERKLAEIFFYFRTQGHRTGIDIENLPSVRGINRPRCNRPGSGGIHVVPPEKLRAGEIRIGRLEILPNLSTVNETVGLFPKLHFGKLPVIPAIRDGTMARRWKAGQV